MTTEVVLENSVCRARVVPAHGGRVASLVDLESGREVLFQRTPALGPRRDYLEASAGGWEEMFPNDSEHGGYPFHGVLWDHAFEVRGMSESELVLGATLERPQVDVEYRFALLPADRRGVRLSISLAARAPTGPFLWASHPMLAVEPGWVIDAPGPIDVDAEMPGRFSWGPLEPGLVADALTVNPPDGPFGEVLYLPAAGRADVADPNGGRRTRVSWDADALPWLWIVAIANDLGIDLALLLEPCTSNPYRLDEALVAGTAVELNVGERRTWWVEVESLDR